MARNDDEWTDEPTCPNCGEAFDPPEELEDDEDKGDVVCEECGAKLRVTLGYFYLVKASGKAAPRKRRAST